MALSEYREPPRTRKLTPEEIQQLEDIRWAEFDPDVLEQYRDKWVVPVNKRIVAAADNVQDALKEAVCVTGLPEHVLQTYYVHEPDFLTDISPDTSFDFSEH